MLLPLHGFVRGDTLGLLVLVHDHDTVETFAKSLNAAAAVRVEPNQRARVLRSGSVLPPHASLASLGIQPLERLDLVVDRESDVTSEPEGWEERPPARGAAE